VVELGPPFGKNNSGGMTGLESDRRERRGPVENRLEGKNSGGCSKFKGWEGRKNLHHNLIEQNEGWFRGYRTSIRV